MQGIFRKIQQFAYTWLVQKTSISLLASFGTAAAIASYGVAHMSLITDYFLSDKEEIKFLIAHPKWVLCFIFAISMAVFQIIRAAIMARTFYPRLTITYDNSSPHIQKTSPHPFRQLYAVKIENKGYTSLSQCQIRAKILHPAESYLYLTDFLEIRPKDDGDVIFPIFYLAEHKDSLLTIMPYTHGPGGWVSSGLSNSKQLPPNRYKMLVEVISKDSVPDSCTIDISHDGNGWKVKQEKKCC